MVFDKSIEVFGGENVTWIGINKRKTKGQFVYASSGENITLSDWGSNQPDNKGCDLTNDLICVFSSQTADCVVIGYEKEKWHDSLCTWELYFICEIIG